MPPPSRSVRRWLDPLAGALARAGLGLLAILPARASLAIARGAGDLLYFLSGRRRNIALRNLDIAFRDSLGRRRKRRIARRSFRHAGGIIAGMASGGAGRGESSASFVTAAAESQLLDRSHDEGLVVLSAHVGDWEMALRYLTVQRGMRLAVITRSVANRGLDREIARLRTCHGARAIPRKGALREIRRALAKGESIGFIADQNCPARRRFFDFFGVPASTYTEYAPLLARLGCRVVFIACIRAEPPAPHRILVRDLTPARAADPRDAAEELIQRYLQVQEEIVRAHPDQYFWMHRRWKSRPAGAPWLYHDLGKPLEARLLEGAAGSP